LIDTREGKGPYTPLVVVFLDRLLTRCFSQQGPRRRRFSSLSPPHAISYLAYRPKHGFNPSLRESFSTTTILSYYLLIQRRPLLLSFPRRAAL